MWFYVMNKLTSRSCDLMFSVLGLIFATPVMSFIFFLGFIETRSPIFRQERLGQNQIPFTLIKFRTMAIETASVATHLADPNAVTHFGGFLRRTKLDELPQLWNVLKGDMSLVGPRPGLLCQEELIEARQRLGVFSVRPGITGLAQVNGVDMSTPELLAKTDATMVNSMSIKNYFTFIFLTLMGSGSGDRVHVNK